ncbi:MAG: tRNA (adenosine(37)-N6)-threonylcarbamoyltransferase complex transferase subunit TsaD, partial [Gammaproteobacteria bacterium]
GEVVLPGAKVDPASQSVKVTAKLTGESPLSGLIAGMSGTAIFPEPALCTDNGAMIAFAGALRLAAGPLPPAPTGFGVRPRWALDELPPLAA